MCLVSRTASKYLDHVMCYVEKVKVSLPDGSNTEPDEYFMREIEELQGIHEAMIDDFRRSLAAYLGVQYTRGPLKIPPITWCFTPQVRNSIRCYQSIQNSMQPLESKWLTWNDNTVHRLAQEIFTKKNWSLMPVLADALEEAGCVCEIRLKHLREAQVDDDWCAAVQDLIMTQGQQPLEN